MARVKTQLHLRQDQDEQLGEDLTHLHSFAIDSEDTEEIDDAVSWDKDEQEAWVHIADVTRFFPLSLSDPILERAFRRGSSSYLATGPQFMFEEENHVREILSLGATHFDGCALSVKIKLDTEGSLIGDDPCMTISRIRTPHRMSYESLESRLMKPNPGRA